MDQRVRSSSRRNGTEAPPLLLSGELRMSGRAHAARVATPPRVSRTRTRGTEATSARGLEHTFARWTLDQAYGGPSGLNTERVIDTMVGERRILRTLGMDAVKPGLLLRRHSDSEGSRRRWLR
jgi:hypothetical protein